MTGTKVEANVYSKHYDMLDIISSTTYSNCFDDSPKKNYDKKMIWQNNPD